jgi:hypothetical protein
MDEKRGGFVLAQTAFYSVFFKKKFFVNNEFFFLPQNIEKCT